MIMATIVFKGKVKQVIYSNGEHAYDYISIPELDRKHCDMAAFRNHPKYGAYANSDLFKGMLAGIKRQFFGSRSVIQLDQVPEGVTVDASGFLAIVTIAV